MPRGMKNMFARIIQFVLQEEGGYSNHPKDPGGATNMGVTQKTLDAYCEENGIPKFNVRELKKEFAIQLYYDKYWRPDWEKLGLALAACMLDTAINMGMGRAIKFLKECDGNYVTFLQLRIAKYKEIIEKNPDLKVFERGWMNRVTRLRRWIEAELQLEKVHEVQTH